MLVLAVVQCVTLLEIMVKKKKRSGEKKKTGIFFFLKFTIIK